MKSTDMRIAVVGGGWAGCAAAVELARKGHEVSLFEASRTLGGRARRVEADGTALDNGQHILLGAYSETLRLMRMVGIDLDDALLRVPLQMRYPDGHGGMEFVTPRLPAPLHMLAGLVRARGLTRDDKLALARFFTTVRWMDWRMNDDCSVTELLDRYDQTERVARLLWRPLCIAALNTPPERASAQVFLNVLRDSLGARRAASDMLIPRVDLSALFPQRAAAYVEQCGGTVRYGASIKKLHRDNGAWRLEANGNACMRDAAPAFDAVVVATPHSHVAALFDGFGSGMSLGVFEHEPITTCYLQYEPQTRLAQPFFALVDDAGAGEWGQFVFDRGHLDTRQAGLLAVVVSASSEAIAPGHEELGISIAAQLAKAFQQPALAQPAWTKVISEKRATFSCTPALARPQNATAVAGLAIAGDYTASDYPATLESAIRSGLQAAHCIAP